MSMQGDRLEKAIANLQRDFLDLEPDTQLARIFGLITVTGRDLMSAIDEAKAMVAAVAVEANEAVTRINELIERVEGGASEDEVRELVQGLIPVRDALSQVTPQVGAPGEGQPVGPDVDPGSQPVPAPVDGQPVNEAPVGPDGQPVEGDVVSDDVTGDPNAARVRQGVDPNTGQPLSSPQYTDVVNNPVTQPDPNVVIGPDQTPPVQRPGGPGTTAPPIQPS
jgi:hypothetical protein